MRVGDIMVPNPVQIDLDADLRAAAELVAQSRVGDLMVLEAGRLVGVLSEGDILRAALPELAEILAQGGSLDDGFAAFIAKGRGLAGRPIAPLVIRDPITLRPDDHVAAAATILITRQIHRLPVVAEGRLLGVVSRADLCRAIVGMPLPGGEEVR